MYYIKITMDISIIIPAYNSEKYIKKCVMSCINQDLPYEQYEIIVVDDGSTDNTKDIINKLQERYECVKYYYQKNSAQGAARNNGLSKATGKYIWFVDSDDWIEENCLSLILNKLERYSLTGVLVGHATQHTKHIDIWYNIEENTILSGREILKCDKYFISPTYAVWSRTFFIENNLKFHERIFHEDTEFYPRLFYNAARIGAISKVCYYVYPNPLSTTRSINPKRAYDMINVVKYINIYKNENIREKEIKQNLMDYIAMNLNVVLFNAFNMNKVDQNNINKILFDNKYLFRNLICSRKIKYKIEGILFILFPHKAVLIYKLLQKLNKAPGGVK